MKHTILIFILFFVARPALAYNPFWINTDRSLIKSVARLDMNNPIEVEHYFRTQKIQRSDTTKENLGFGWKIWSPGIGGGYISISATFIYYYDSIVSYTIIPQLPDEKELLKRYKIWYCDSFAIEADKISPFTYNGESLLRPLAEYEGTLSTETVPRGILEYMSPNSGTMYGYVGGYGGDLLQNRRAFLHIKNRLTNEHVIYMMYSINPASRLTAIEYYFRNRDSFANQQTLDEWVEIALRETSRVETLFGCSSETHDARFLVHMFSLMETIE